MGNAISYCAFVARSLALFMTGIRGRLLRANSCGNHRVVRNKPEEGFTTVLISNVYMPIYIYISTGTSVSPIIAAAVRTEAIKATSSQGRKREASAVVQAICQHTLEQNG